MNSLRLSRLSRALRPPAGILLAMVGWCGALASPAVSATDSMAELFDGRLPLTQGNDPIFNSLDADRSEPDRSSAALRSRARL